MQSLPGRILRKQELSVCVMCDTDNVLCTVYQGETDSFGCEENPICQACEPAYKRSCVLEKIGECDYCHHHVTDREYTRDPDEGNAGPVYLVCLACRRDVYRQRAEQDQYQYELQCEEEYEY